MIGIKISVVQHTGTQEMRDGTRKTVLFDQDRVVIEEGYYDDIGNEQVRRYCAGYCQRKPGAAFVPVVNLPDDILLDIKRQLADRDAAETGGSVFDYFEREIGHAPPMIDESDDDDDQG